MKNFIQKWILHNLAYKIIALLIAVVVWITFTYSDDPIKPYSFDTVVEVLHQQEFEEQGRYVEIDGTSDFSSLKVTVNVRGRNSVIDSLRNRAVSAYMKVYVDLYELENDESNRLIIHYEIIDHNLQSKVEFVSYKNKSYYPVEVEENLAVSIPVNYVITGTPAEGYMYVKDDPEIMVSPATITITGPATQLAQIDHAQVTVSVEDASANVNKTGNLLLQDADGKTIAYSRDAIWTSTNEAAVFVPIYTYKTVSIQPYLSGSAPSGYQYTGDVALDNNMVTIYGTESVLKKIYSISLPEIALASVRGEYAETFDLQQVLDDAYGENMVHLMDKENDSVTVTFTVAEQVTEVISVPVSSITVYGLADNLTITFGSDKVDVSVFGLPEAMEDFNSQNITLALRLTASQKTPGSYNIALEVGGLGTGVQYRAVTVSVTISEKESTENNK